MTLDRVYSLYINLQKFFSETHVLYQVLQQSIYKYLLLKRLIDTGVLEKSGHRRDNLNLVPTVVITKKGTKMIRYKRRSPDADRGKEVPSPPRGDVSEMKQRLFTRLNFLNTISKNSVFQSETIQERLQFYKKHPEMLLRLDEFTEEFNDVYASISNRIRRKLSEVLNHANWYRISGKDRDELVSYLQMEEVNTDIKEYVITRRNITLKYYLQDDDRVFFNRFASNEGKFVMSFKDLKGNSIQTRYKSNLFNEEIDELKRLLEKYNLYDRYANEFDSFKNYLQFILLKDVVENIDTPEEIPYRIQALEPQEHPIHISIDVDQPNDKTREYLSFLKETDPELYTFVAYLYNHGLFHFVYNIPTAKGAFYPRYGVMVFNTTAITDKYDFMSTLFHETTHLFTSIRFSHLEEADDINEVMFKFFSLLSINLEGAKAQLGNKKLRDILDENSPSTIHDIADIVNNLLQDQEFDRLYTAFLDQIRENIFTLLKVNPAISKRITLSRVKNFLTSQGLSELTPVLLRRNFFKIRDLSDEVISASIYSLAEEVYAEGITASYLYNKFGEDIYSRHVRSLVYHYDFTNLDDFEVSINYFHTYRQILEGLLDGKPKYYSMLLMHILQFV